MKQSGDNQDPMYRLFFREGSVGRKLLGQVRKDLADVVKVCEGSLKQTNHLRTLMGSLTKGASIPTLPCSKFNYVIQGPSPLTGDDTKSPRRWL
jgi:hypothetical protein